MTDRNTPRRATCAALAGTLVLAGCLDMGDMWASEPRPLRVIDETQTAAVAPQQAPLPPAADTDIAARAENACLRAGEDEGFRVIDVLGSRARRDDDGFLTGRDVQLRVERGGQRFEIRCAYSAEADSARIMTL